MQITNAQKKHKIFYSLHFFKKAKYLSPSIINNHKCTQTNKIKFVNAFYIQQKLFISISNRQIIYTISQMHKKIPYKDCIIAFYI